MKQCSCTIFVYKKKRKPPDDFSEGFLSTCEITVILKAKQRKKHKLFGFTLLRIIFPVYLLLHLEFVIHECTLLLAYEDYHNGKRALSEKEALR